MNDARQAIWDDYFSKIATVAQRSGASAAEARGIKPSEAHAEAREIYPKLREERDARLRQLSQGQLQH